MQALGLALSWTLAGLAPAVAQTPRIQIEPTAFEARDLGDEAVYRVRLNKNPSENVTVTPEVIGAGRVSPPTLTFTPTNGRTAQEVTFTPSWPPRGRRTIRYTGAGADFNEVRGPEINVYFDDPEQHPRVNLEPVTARVAEGGSFEFKIKLSRETTKPFQILYRTKEDSTAIHRATPGIDYVDGSRTVTFEPGDSEKTVRFAATQDERSEHDETFAVELYSLDTRSVTPGLHLSGTFTIVNDDQIEVRFEPRTYSVHEGDGAAVIKVILTKPSDKRELPVNMYAFGDTADAGTDYRVQPTTIRFRPGETERTVPIAIIDDNEVESRERFQLQILSPADVGSDEYTITVGNGYVDIDDNETTVTVEPGSGREGEMVGFDVTLGQAIPRDVTFSYATSIESTDTAETGDLALTNTGQMLVRAGESRGTIEVTSYRDDDTDDETFTLTLSSPVNAELRTTSVQGTVYDTSNVVDVELGLAASSVDEGGSVEVRMTPQAAPDHDLQVVFRLVGAVDGDQVDPAMVTIPAGSTERATTTVHIADDDVYHRLVAGRDYYRALNVQAQVARGPGTVTANARILHVREDEDKPTIEFQSGSYIAREGRETVLTVKLEGKPAEAVRTSYRTVNGTARGGRDYVAKTGQLVFMPDETEKEIRILGIKDNLFEAGPRTFSVELHGADTTRVTTGPKHTAQVRVDDATLARINLQTTPTVEEGNRQIGITVSTDTRLGVPITLRLRAMGGAVQGRATNGTSATRSAGDDFYFEDTEFTLTSSRRAHSVNLRIWDDFKQEGNETFTLLIEVPDSELAPWVETAAASKTITIADNDTKGVETARTTLVVGDGATTGSYRVRLGTEPTGAVTVTPTIVGGGTGASVLPAQLTFTQANWNVYQTLAYTVADDFGNATITHATTGADYATAPSLTVTLKGFHHESDPELRMTPERVTLTESPDSSQRRYTFRITLGHPVRNRIRIRWETRDGTSVAPRDYRAQSGTLVFNPGDVEKTITGTITDDDLLERTEQFTVYLRHLADLPVVPIDASQNNRYDPITDELIEVGELLIARSVAIQDDDKTSVGFTETVASVHENAGKYVGRLRVQDDVIFLFRLLARTDEGGTARSGPSLRTTEDYAPISEVLTLEYRKGDLSVDVPIFDDRYAEADETFLLSLLRRNAIDQDISVAPARTVVTIIDDDEAGVEVSETDIVLFEGQSVTYDVTLQSWIQGALTVNRAVEGARGTTVSPGVRLEATRVNTASVMDTELPKASFTLHAPQDHDEEDETITITHTFEDVEDAAGEYRSIEIPSVTVRVLDDEKLGITPIPGSIRTNATTRNDHLLDTITRRLGTRTARSAWLTEGWEQSFSVRVPGSTTQRREMHLVLGGTAREGSDYRLEVDGRRLSAPYRIAFAPGVDDVVLKLTVLNDGNDSEGTETLTLQGMHNGEQVNHAPYKIDISPCGGNDPETFAWMSVAGEHPLRRHHQAFQPDDPIEGPSFKLRVCFRDTIKSLTIGPGGNLSLIGGSLTPSEFGYSSGDLENLREMAPGQMWTADVTAHAPGRVNLFLSLDALRYANGNPIESDEVSINWHPAVRTGSGPPVYSAFTARFRPSPPRSHNGVWPFTVGVEFSKPPRNGLRRSAVDVEGADITTLEATDDEQRRFEMELTPRGDDDISIGLRVAESCDLREVVELCSEDAQPLAQALGAVIEGPADTGPEQPAPGDTLTAEFVDAPAEYYGRFRLKIAFSEPIVEPASTLRRAVKVGDNAILKGVSKVDDRADLWEVTVVGNSYGYTEDIRIDLSPDISNCNDSRAVCAAGNKALQNRPSVVIKAPATIGIEDATAREGVDANIVFNLTLSRALRYPASVRWHTEDGTAVSGEDFEGGTGLVELPRGASSGHIAIPLLDDAIDEAEEQFTVVLTNARGVILSITGNEQRAATGTIVNDDHLPQAWLARFGRTVASQAVDAIGDRVTGATMPHARIAGVGLGEGEAKEDEDPRLGIDDLAHDDGQSEIESRSIGEAFKATSFLIGSKAEGNGPQWSAWGRFETSRFEANIDDIALDGDVDTGFIGADVAHDDWLAGVALGVSEGSGGYTLADGGDSATMKSSLNAIYPYARLSLGQGTDVWAAAGLGEGTLELIQASGRRYRPDISMRMGAIGAHKPLNESEDPGALMVSGRADAFWVRTESEQVHGPGGNLEASRAEVTRMRIALDADREFGIGAGTLTPSVTVGLRHDGGDAETGTGLEVRSAVKFASGGLSIEGAVQGLAAHEDADYEEWGTSVTARLEPGANGRGLSLRIAPSIGAATNVGHRLWTTEGQLALGGRRFESERRIEAELGYGVGLRANRGVVTPYSGVALGDAGNRAWRIGARWEVAQGAALGIEATQRAGSAKEQGDREVRILAAMRW